MMHKILPWLALLTLLSSSCDLINPPEEIPAYLYVANFDYQTNPFVPDHTTTTNITHAYVFIGEESMGLFTLPATVPVLQQGEQDLIIDPVIPENGLYSNLRIHPFYKRFEGTATLIPAQTDTVYPVTSYTDQTSIVFLEDFEGNSSLFNYERDGDDSTSMEITHLMAREGAGAGYILLTTEHPVIDVATPASQLFELKDKNLVYLEADYKTEAEMRFGLVGFDATGPVGSSYEFGVLPKEGWNKIYFNLTDQVRASGFNEYQIALTAALPEGKDSAEIYLDNIKLLYE